MKQLIIIALSLYLSLANSLYAQNSSWMKDEKKNYTTIKSLCKYYKEKQYDTTQRNFVFKKFIYFNYVLADTSKERIQKRINWFDGLFYKLVKYVDSVKFENLDAKPTRLFENDSAFFAPFTKGRELDSLLPSTLAYFDKRHPDKPLGVLFFEQKSHRLAAWIIIDQGGYKYFLTFNLV